MSSLYSCEKKRNDVSLNSAKPCEQIIHKGWKYKVMKNTCICAVALPKSERQRVEKECSERMKSMIDQNNGSMCTLIKVVPTRKRREKTVNEPRELLRERIFDMFGVKPENHEERKRPIFIRPSHFHQSFLQKNNEGLIQPMNWINAEALVSTTSGEISMETSMLHISGVFHPLPSLHENASIETIHDMPPAPENECDDMAIHNMPSAASGRHIKTPLQWLQKRKRSANLTSARRGEDRHRTRISATPNRNAQSPISKIANAVRSIGKDRRNQRKAKQRGGNSTSEVDRQEIQQQSAPQVIAAATRRGISDITNLLSTRGGEVARRKISTNRSQEDTSPMPTRDRSNLPLRCVQSHKSMHQKSPAGMSLDTSFNSQTETDFQTIYPQNKDDKEDEEELEAFASVLFPDSTENFSPSSLSIREEQLQGDNDRTPTDAIDLSMDAEIVRPTEVPMEVDDIIRPKEVDGIVRPTELDETVRPTEVGEIVRPTEVGEIVRPTEVDEIVRPTEVDEIVRPTEVDEIVHRTEMDEIVHPTEVDEEVDEIFRPVTLKVHRQLIMKELYQFTESVIGSEKVKKDQSKFAFFKNLRYGKKSSKTSHYRLKNVIGHAADALTAAIWPTFSKEERILALIDQLNLLVDKDKVAEEKAIAKTGVELCKFIASKKTPMERRPFLAFVRKAGATRKVAADMLSRAVSKYEWRMVGQHCKYPGPGEAVSRVHPVRYQRVNMSTIDTMFEFLQDRNYLEATSYGVKNVRTCDGQIKQIESVKRTATVSEMYREFIKGLTSMINPDDEDNGRNAFLNDDDDDDDDDDGTDHNEEGDDGDPRMMLHNHKKNKYISERKYSRMLLMENDDIDPTQPPLCQVIRDDCTARCPDSKLFCSKKNNHVGQHSYHIPGYMSKSFFSKLCKSLTDGQIKNLAGLDNTDVLKGYENFVEMERIVDQLVELGHLQTAEYDILKDRIKAVQAYHKAGFMDHLASESAHSCACIQCGFHNEKDDPIECKHRTNNSHLPPCEKCNECFRVIADMFNLHEKVHGSDNVNLDGMQQDILCNLKSRIGTCKINLEDYRAHVAQKFWESAEDKDFFGNLKPGEAAVISDWKMKILASYFRENMSKFFGKKGFSLIGFMIVYGSDTSTNEVQYVFMLTDDTSQDVQSVLAAKQLLYNEILHKEGVSKVHFRSDGAGCFSTKVHKAAMPRWKEWTDGKVDEISFKISVAGCGKTNLDGLFGVMTHMIFQILRKGFSFSCAKQLYNLFADNPIQASSFVLYAPDRSIKFDITKGADGKKELLKGLQAQYHLIKDTDEETIKCYRHSYLGKGTEFSIDEMDEALVHLPTTGSPSGKDTSSDHVEAEDIQDGDPITTVPLSDYEDINTSASAEPPRFFLIDSTHEALEHSERSIQHTETWQERRHEKMKDRKDKANARVQSSLANHIETMKENGLFCCNVKHPKSGDRCMKQYTSKQYLLKHQIGSKHVFPSIDSNTAAIRRYTDASKAGVKFGIGSRTNLCDAVRERSQILDDPNVAILNHPSLDDYFKNPGCYNSRRKTPSRHSAALLEDLERMFLQGENGGQKYTDEQAHKELSRMTTEHGRLKYTADENNSNGPCPRKEQIKQWFGQRKKKGPKKARITIEMLKNRCIEYGLPTKPKECCSKILQLDDILLDTSARAERSYATMKKIDLVDEICARKMITEETNLTNADMYRILLQKHTDVMKKNGTSNETNMASEIDQI